MPNKVKTTSSTIPDADNTHRKSNEKELDIILANWIKDKDSYDVMALLQNAGHQHAVSVQ